VTRGEDTDESSDEDDDERSANEDEDSFENGDEDERGDDEGEDEDADEYELDPDQAASDALTIDKLEAKARKSSNISENDLKFGRTTLSKLHSLTKRIHNSPTLTDDLAELCKKHDRKPLKVIKSVPTRWNSVAMESKRAIYLRAPLDSLVTLPRHNSTRGRGRKLKSLKLSQMQWQMLEQLAPILSHFLNATERMSVSKQPLLHNVILIINILEAMLKKAANDTNLHPLVRYGVTLGRDVLNKYYSKTDESIMYRCAIHEFPLPPRGPIQLTMF
ncbi:hypothetical protein OH76DRAFT_1341398, partial [Lentinus brumalis]